MVTLYYTVSVHTEYIHTNPCGLLSCFLGQSNKSLIVTFQWKTQVEGFVGADGVAMLVKVLEGISSSCLATSVFICSVSMLFVILISAYWPFLFSRPISVSSSLSQVVSFAARVSATYSTSADERATVAYLLEHQLTGPPFNMKMKPDVEFLVTWSPAQSESK